jgi:hypothetical protein
MRLSRWNASISRKTLRKPPNGTASSTRSGKSRSFVRPMISRLRRVILPNPPLARRFFALNLNGRSGGRVLPGLYLGGNPTESHIGRGLLLWLIGIPLSINLAVRRFALNCDPKRCFPSSKVASASDEIELIAAGPARPLLVESAAEGRLFAPVAEAPMFRACRTLDIWPYASCSGFTFETRDCKAQSR